MMQVPGEESMTFAFIFSRKLIQLIQTNERRNRTLISKKYSFGTCASWVQQSVENGTASVCDRVPLLCIRFEKFVSDEEEAGKEKINEELFLYLSVNDSLRQTNAFSTALQTSAISGLLKVSTSEEEKEETQNKVEMDSAILSLMCSCNTLPQFSQIINLFACVNGIPEEH